MADGYYFGDWQSEIKAKLHSARKKKLQKID
jgi:hypothetical protein